MKTTAFLSLGLLSVLPSTFAVLLNITESPWADGRPLRNTIVDIPYANSSLLPKDQICYPTPFS
ncbi:hypothetical protein BJX99DRAFT_258848 [Aspergillus californicus]